jgi:hypothetical protein
MPDLDAELTALRTDLDTETKAADAAGAKARAIRARIEVVQRQINEEGRLAQAVKAKEEAYLKEKIPDSIASNQKTIRAALEALSAGKPDKVDKALPGVDKVISDLAEKSKASAVESADAVAKVKQSEEKVSDAKKAFEDSFRLPEEIGKQIEAIKSLKAKADKAEEAEDFTSAYVYITESAELAKKLKFPDGAAISTTISGLRKAWNDANAGLENDKNAAAASAVTAATYSKALQAKQTSRLNDLIQAAKDA